MTTTAAIKIELIKKQIKQVDIAKALGITPCAVGHYVHEREKSARFDKWVLENLGLDLPAMRDDLK